MSLMDRIYQYLWYIVVSIIIIVIIVFIIPIIDTTNQFFWYLVTLVSFVMITIFQDEVKKGSDFLVNKFNHWLRIKVYFINTTHQLSNDLAEITNEKISIKKKFTASNFRNIKDIKPEDIQWGIIQFRKEDDQKTAEKIIIIQLPATSIYKGERLVFKDSLKKSFFDQLRIELALYKNREDIVSEIYSKAERENRLNELEMFRLITGCCACKM